MWHRNIYPVKNQEQIEEDQGFLLPEEGNPAFSCNQSGIRSAKIGQIDNAEKILDECIKSHPNVVITHLNRLRLYYLLEEFEKVKKKIEIESPSVSSTLYKAILTELEKKYRDEERVITLDALSRTKGWELFSYEELAKFYTSKGNLSFAAGYWNQILEVNPFYEEALYGMIEIQTLNGKWFSVLDYAKSLSVAAKKNREFHYFYIKANFELGRYAEALKWVDSASAKEKTQISFLEVWRDCLLLGKDKPDWSPLLPYYQKVKEQGYTIPESIFFPTLDPTSKELRKAIRSGRQ